MSLNHVEIEAVHHSLLPMSLAAIWYAVQLPNDKVIRLIVSAKTSVADAINYLARKFSDCPLLSECQLLRDGFPLSKSSRLCALKPKNVLEKDKNGRIVVRGLFRVDVEFVMAYADPDPLTEEIIDAVVEHAVVTQSGSPRRHASRGDGNVYTPRSRRQSDMSAGSSTDFISRSIRHVVPSKPQHFTSFASPRPRNQLPSSSVLQNEVAIQYRAGSGFRAVSNRLHTSLADAPSFPITVRLLASGARELRRINVRPDDPVAMLRDELFPTPESSIRFRLYCDDYPILNESASFVELMINSDNVIEFRADVENEDLVKGLDLYEGSVVLSTENSVYKGRSRASSVGSASSAISRLSPRDASPHRIFRGQSTAKRYLADRAPSLGNLGSVMRGDPIDDDVAGEQHAMYRTLRLGDTEANFFEDDVWSPNRNPSHRFVDEVDQTVLEFQEREAEGESIVSRRYRELRSPEPSSWKMSRTQNGRVVLLDASKSKLPFDRQNIDHWELDDRAQIPDSSALRRPSTSTHIRSPPTLRTRASPPTRIRSPPSTRARSPPQGRLFEGRKAYADASFGDDHTHPYQTPAESVDARPLRMPAIEGRSAFSTSTVGEAARSPVVKKYDPKTQIPIVFVDPEDNNYLHRLNVYGTHKLTQLRNYSSPGSGSMDIVCDGVVVVPSSVRNSDITFWDITDGKPGKLFSLRSR